MEEGQSPILLSCPSLKIYLSTTSWFLPQFSRTDFSVHARERKLVFPVSFLPAHVCKLSKKKTARLHKWSMLSHLSHMCALSLLLSRGPTAITAFSWKRLCSISENKITNFIPKISQQSSVLVPQLQLEESERQSHLQDPRMRLGTQQQSLKLCSSPQSATQPSSPLLGTVEMGHHLLHTG